MEVIQIQSVGGEDEMGNGISATKTINTIRTKSLRAIVFDHKG